MSKYFVVSTKCGVTEGGMACGPVSGDVIVTVEFKKDGGPSQWLSNAECQGFATLYLNDFDPFSTLMSGDVDNPQFGVGMIDEFEGISFMDYEDLFYVFNDEPENEAIPLLRYLIAVTRCSAQETDELIKNAEGKYVDELDIPISDIEQDYIDDLEED